jgi:hypothetical protein
MVGKGPNPKNKVCHIRGVQIAGGVAGITYPGRLVPALCIIYPEQTLERAWPIPVDIHGTYLPRFAATQILAPFLGWATTTVLM